MQQWKLAQMQCSKTKCSLSQVISETSRNCPPQPVSAPSVGAGSPTGGRGNEHVSDQDDEAGRMNSPSIFWLLTSDK